MAVLSVSVHLFDEPFEIKSVVLDEVSYARMMTMYAVYLFSRRLRLDFKNMKSLQDTYNRLIPKPIYSWLEIVLRKAGTHG